MHADMDVKRLDSGLRKCEVDVGFVIVNCWFQIFLVQSARKGDGDRRQSITTSSEDYELMLSNTMGTKATPTRRRAA